MQRGRRISLHSLKNSATAPNPPAVDATALDNVGKENNVTDKIR